MMKKTLVALAAAAATGAFAQVTIQGTVDIGVSQIDLKGSQTTTVGSNNGSGTSAISFRGTEDLGGGLRAGFQWDATLDLTNTGSRSVGTTAVGTTSNVTSYLGNGESFLHIGGGFGTVKLGTPNTSSYKNVIAAGGGFGTSVGSSFRTVTFDVARFQNALRYESPSMNGFSLTLHVVTKNDQQKTADNAALGNNVNQLAGRDSVQELGLDYKNKDLMVAYSRLQMTQDAGSNPTVISESSSSLAIATTGYFLASGNQFQLDTLAGTYKLGNATLGAFTQRVSSGTLNKAVASGVSTAIFDRNVVGYTIAYNVNSNLVLRGIMSQVSINTADTSTTSGAGKITSNTGLGVDYLLSKRTALYGRYEMNNDEAGLRSTSNAVTTTTGNNKYTATAVGIRHTF